VSQLNHRALILRLLIPLLGLYAAGCAQTSRSAVVPATLNDNLIDITGVRAESSSITPQIQDRVERAVRWDLQRASAQTGDPPPKSLNILAITGGGVYGAFDVGILKGWTDSGNRPEFDVVTGVSTGAFIAPFAFLGKKYDDFLVKNYLDLTADQIYREKSLISGILSESIASSKPLKRKIEGAITQEVFDEIAAAHKKGLRLYVGTTNLDTRALVIWDLGAIAASGKPGALELMRNVILASGSVPGFYPPAYIDIEVNGKKYQEMHVDGGASCNVFVRPFMLGVDKQNPGNAFGSNVYVISSGKLFADSGKVDPNLIDITTSAITSLLYAGTRSDINAIYNLALDTGMNFNLTAVPDNLTISGDCLSVDPKEMRTLFQTGYQLSLSGRCWSNKPPDAAVKKDDSPRTGVELKLRQ